MGLASQYRAQIKAKIIQHAKDAGETDVVAFVSAYMAAKAPPACEDADFFLAVAADWVKDAASSAFPKIVSASKRGGYDKQLVLNGFEFLQTVYPVIRNNRQMIVSVTNMTDDELDARARELTAMSKGCMRHADELRQYRASRATVRA